MNSAPYVDVSTVAIFFEYQSIGVALRKCSIPVTDLYRSSGNEGGDYTLALVPEKGQRCNRRQRSRKEVTYLDDYPTFE